MPHDADAEFIRQVARATAALVVAAEHGDRLQIIAALNGLLATLVERRNAPIERPSDEALRQAIARL